MEGGGAAVGGGGGSNRLVENFQRQQGAPSLLAKGVRFSKHHTHAHRDKGQAIDRIT